MPFALINKGHILLKLELWPQCLKNQQQTKITLIVNIVIFKVWTLNTEIFNNLVKFVWDFEFVILVKI